MDGMNRLPASLPVPQRLREVDWGILLVPALPPSESDNRRVLAVLAFLNS